MGVRERKGTLVCIDGTFATPINQKALDLGAGMVLQSGTKYPAGHNDVIYGCISGSKKVISTIRALHHVVGGVINPLPKPQNEASEEAAWGIFCFSHGHNTTRKHTQKWTCCLKNATTNGGLSNPEDERDALWID
ncbi:hypothetical protein ACLOJK_022272 [Asimina triloba]